MHCIFHVSVPQPIKGPCFLRSESIFPFPDSARFAPGLPLLLTPNHWKLRETWHLQGSPSLTGPSSPQSIKFGRAMGISCLKAPWLLSYLICLNALTFWDAYFWNVHKTVLPPSIKDQDTNAPSILRSMKITVDPTTFIHHVMPLLNKDSLLLMTAQRNTHIVLGSCWSSVNTCPIRCAAQGLSSTGCMLGGAERNCVAPFFKKIKIKKSLPFPPLSRHNLFWGIF